MAEASSTKRSWPWKKKAQEKPALTPDSVESSPRASPHDGRFGEEQDVSKVLSDHARVSEEAMQQWLHSESKLKQLNEKLQAVQTDLSSKDILVRQHAKVAEEAVTGWEKAEAEAAALKQQLDMTMHQKLATEDRVSHLDGALKECMKQLRHVREEQEQRIHETIVKKTREYDTLRQEMEVKLGDVGAHLQEARAEIIECRGESQALTIALEDSTKALAEVNDSRARSEGGFRILQVRLESAEKECSTSKYELQVLKRELEIRNTEIESERKVTENAGKNQIENVKKIAKLEAECHKLRILVRQKLPGPAALAQMKVEVGALERNTSAFDSKRRRSLGASRNVTSSRDLSRHTEGLLGSLRGGDSDRSGTNREAEALVEKLVGMDDELKMLKEALASRDRELQESRLMCAKTASKLSIAEEQLEAALLRRKRKTDGLNNVWGSFRKYGSVGESGDAWDAASALLAELDQVKKASDKGLDVRKLDLMDDFAEMEKLAMTSDNRVQADEEDSDEASEKSLSGLTAAFEEKLAAKERDLEAANRKCKETSVQLRQVQEEVAALQSRNRANEAGMVSLQEKLDKYSDKLQGEDYCSKDCNITKELEDLVQAQAISLRAGAAHEAMLYDLEEGSQNGAGVHGENQRCMSSRSSSEVKYEVNEDIASVLSDAESKTIIVGSDLLTAVQNVVRVVAALVDATGNSEHDFSDFQLQHQNEWMPESPVQQFMEWKNPDLYNGMHSLIGISNKLLQEKSEVAEFLAELTAVLNCLVNEIFRAKKLDQIAENYQHPGGSDHANGDANAGEHRRVSPDKPSSVESLSQAEMGLLTALEDGSPKPKASSSEEAGADLDAPALNNVEVTKGNHIREGSEGPSAGGLRGSNGRVVNGNGVDEWSVSNSELGRDMRMLHKKVAVLEGELQGERRRHQEVVLRYLDLHQQIRSEGGGGSNSASSAGSRTKEGVEGDCGYSQHRQQNQSPDVLVVDMRTTKDHDMQSAADKLAECQRSILDLGKQLQALSAPLPGDSVDALSDTACSSDRYSRSSTDHNSLQMRALDTDSGNTTTSDLHSRTYSNRARQDFALGGAGDFFDPSSPFIEKRDSLSLTPSLVHGDGRGSDH